MDQSSVDIDELLASSGSEYEPEESSVDSDFAVDSDASDEYYPTTRRKNALKKDSDEPARKKPRNQQDKADSIKKPKVKRTLPFERFMEGVVFVISGFQNPLRGDIRSKGIAMGAKYRADWDRSCTHLICAFPNTPKFNQVRGHGKIVKKEWIEDSYSKRIRLPWRRYALDRRDMSSPESEDEIYEQEDDPAIEDQVTAQSAISDDDYDDGPRPSLFPHLIKTPLKQDPGPSTSKQEEMDIDNDIAENTSPR